jgi:hypothetical protein
MNRSMLFYDAKAKYTQRSDRKSTFVRNNEEVAE